MVNWIGLIKGKRSKWIHDVQEDGCKTAATQIFTCSYSIADMLSLYSRKLAYSTSAPEATGGAEPGSLHSAAIGKIKGPR
eukprot:scaffold54418_cov31-Tisochrysis_lutea.AAC.3